MEKERKQPFFTLGIFLSVITLFMAILSIVNPEESINLIITHFLLGLIFILRAVEMIVTKERKYFVLTIITSVFIIALASFNLWNLLDGIR